MIVNIKQLHYIKAAFFIMFLLLLNSCSRPIPSFHDYTQIDTTYPQQSELTEPDVKIITYGKDSFTIHPKAEYRVGALVRSKRAYRTDRMAKISPNDFALVWGILTDKHYYRQINISKGGRRYFFKLKKGAQLSVDWVYLNSSNHHLIPANDNIRRALRSVRKNDVIELEGYLVNVHGNIKGRTFNWNTSLSREDKGDGSCEIMYVRRIKIRHQVYE